MDDVGDLFEDVHQGGGDRSDVEVFDGPSNRCIRHVAGRVERFGERETSVLRRLTLGMKPGVERGRCLSGTIGGLISSPAVSRVSLSRLRRGRRQLARGFHENVDMF